MASNYNASATTPQNHPPPSTLKEADYPFMTRESGYVLLFSASMTASINYFAAIQLPSTTNTVFLTCSAAMLSFVCLFLLSKRRVFNLLARVSMLATLIGNIYNTNMLLLARTPDVSWVLHMSLAGFVIFGIVSIMKDLSAGRI